MNSEYDPQLQALFAEAKEAFDRDAFTRRVMAEVDAGRRRAMGVSAVIAAAAIIVLALLADPVLAALRLMTDLLPVSVVEIENDWINKLLAPINSVAALLALLALGVRKFYRRIFR